MIESGHRGIGPSHAAKIAAALKLEGNERNEFLKQASKTLTAPGRNRVATGCPPHLAQLLAQHLALLGVDLSKIDTVGCISIPALFSTTGERTLNYACERGAIMGPLKPLPQAGGALARVAVSIPVAPTVPRDTRPPLGPHALGGESNQPELLDQLRNIDWFQFETIVGLTYRKHGFHVIQRGGANPDGGIDLLITKDGETKAVQCKQWKAWNVGVKAIREFLGALTDAGIQKGVFITLRGYTGEAKQLADKHGIEIVNEAGLAEMLAATDARFDPEVLEILGDTRKFCPKCECEMVLRTAGRGAGAGRQFWGCSSYPRCRFTMPVAA